MLVSRTILTLATGQHVSVPRFDELKRTVTRMLEEDEPRAATASIRDGLQRRLTAPGRMLASGEPWLESDDIVVRPN